ncbi:hypothetical protein [Frankia gtarii]|uniref:hypothetical protein n=1 Tax=Frankia gtarii TaxID=2950102 RepID=UPI0021BF543E|nr:hypothetical protein [Frankia gtarii]
MINTHTPAVQADETRPDTIIAPAAPVASAPPPHPGEQRIVLHTVTTLVTAVVALSFIFGLGNVWALGIRLGVPAYIAPLVAPAVDLSVVALLVATRQLALAGASRTHIRPAQRLLIFCSLVTLALNTAEPTIEGHYGRAAFDAVGCCLLIGWSHIAPDLLHSLQTATNTGGSANLPVPARQTGAAADPDTQNDSPARDVPRQTPLAATEENSRRQQKDTPDPDLIRRARLEDARHWETHHRPISAETLRKSLHIGARTARGLVLQLRDDSRARLPNRSGDTESLPAAV